MKRPLVSESEASRVVVVHYGYDVTKTSPLNSYDDVNIWLEAKKEGEENVQLVLKVLNSEDSNRTEFIGRSNFFIK